MPLLFSLQCSPASILDRATPESSPAETTISTTEQESANHPPDLLGAIQARGYLKVGVRVWPDAEFRPPLYRAPLAGLDGYEVDLAWALAKHLAVDLEMAESDPRRLAAGNWGGEWDIALAWLPITDNAQQALLFSDPYAYDVAQIAVHHQNETITQFSDLAGQTVGVPAFTIYQQVLSGQAISVAGQFVTGAIPPEMVLVGYNRDGQALRDLADGQGDNPLAAVFHSRPVLLGAIEAELPLRLIEPPLFVVPIGVALDRAGLSAERLRLSINEVIETLRREGKLAEFSLERYEEDISAK